MLPTIGALPVEGYALLNIRMAFDPQKQEIIRRYVCDYWIEAVNTLGKYGQWALLEVNSVDNLNELLTNKIQNL